ncbi:MAG TPA: VIT1/CCC1 transporter family protein [Anaerolineales bacterium]|nr:VIT1/CCC1 transporter family protein [Anaerolineales bacterium]
MKETNLVSDTNTPLTKGKLIEQVRLHDHRDPHRHESRLSDVILGGQDGLVNVLGVILGVAAATQDARIVIAAGLAATFAESISMGAVAYTSTLANNDLYRSERDREYRHIHLAPDVEIEEIRDIYRNKGFEGETLEKIIEVITSNPDVWVNVMMSEELQMTPPEKTSALRSAFIVGLSALAGSLIPLCPFFFWSVGLSIGLSIVIAALTLFVVGAYKARVTVGRPFRSGMQMAVIGTISALAGYVVGFIFKVPTAP